MDGFALSLVLGAAGIHATWNLLAKQATGGALFVWMFSVLSMVLFAPLAGWILIVNAPDIGWAEAGFLIGTAMLHTGYYICLQRAYAVGDLSLIYPLARSTGPLLATITAIAILGERPSALALAGGLLILLGVVMLTPGSNQGEHGSSRVAIAFGLLTGILIASYTVWDKYSVHTLLLPPLLVDYASQVGRTILLTPLVLRRREQIVSIWRKNRRQVVGVAILGPLSYIMVLTAMQFTPVSYVAPAREISILIGAFFGAQLLGEGQSLRRLASAAVMVCGIAALVLG